MLQMLLGNLAQVRFQVEAQFSDHVHFSYIMTWRMCWEAGHVVFYLSPLHSWVTVSIPVTS